MKTLARIACLAAAATLLAGCAASKPAPEPVSTRTPAEILDAVRASVPATTYASVTEVSEADGWIALGEATAGDLPVGTVVSIVDEDAHTIGQAEVKTSETGKIYAKFYKGAGREVRVGDVAVKF